MSASVKAPRGVRAERSDPSSPASQAGKRRKCDPSSAGKGKSKVPDNVWENDLNIEEVFPDVTGAARIEAIFQVFGDPREEYVDVPWFQPDNRPTLVSDTLNRPLQQSTVRDYERRIFDSGLAVDCSGNLDWVEFG